MTETYLYRVTPGNFGDDLNERLVNKYFPFTSPDRVYLGKETQHLKASDNLLVMIGTILNKRVPSAPKKIVLGSGVGYGEPPILDNQWTFGFVRGPLSAKALCLDPSHAITDPAILVADSDWSIPALSRSAFGYMPHHATASPLWEGICQQLGIRYIDPRQTDSDVVAAMKSVDVLITEAMHGAILADAFRLPWVAVKSAEKINDFKWHDWTQSLGLTYQPMALPSLWKNTSPLKHMMVEGKVQVAKWQLRKIMNKCAPQLSELPLWQSKYQQMEEVIEHKAERLQLQQNPDAASAY